MSMQMDGASRCAVLLYSLGMESASAILGQLEPQQVKRIAEAAKRLRGVEQDSVDDVLKQFQESMTGRKLLPGESAEFIQSVIAQSGLEDEQEELPERGLVPDADAENLAQLLKREHPQTTALVLSHIDPDRAANVLNMMKVDRRIQVMARMAKLTQVSEAILQRIEVSLRTELARRSSGPSRKLDGVELAAGVLKRLGKEEASEILDGLASEDGQLHDAVKQKMFTFEELGNMDDGGIRNLLKEIDSQVLAKALKVADENVKDKFFKNMSERAASMLAEDVETLPPMRLAEVEEAQNVIVEAAATLIQDGKALIIGGAGDDVV